MKKVNNNPKLPEWFNREKYKSLENLSLIDWALNLIIRSCIFDEISDIRIDMSNKNCHQDDIRIDGFKKEFDQIQASGILSREFLQDIYDDYDLEKLEPGFGVVYPMPLHRAVSIYKTIQADTELRHNLEYVKYREIFITKEKIL